MLSLNQAFPFWASLTELQQQEILDSAIIRQYASGETVRKNAGLYMVNDGCIIAYSSYENGRRSEAFSTYWMESMLLTQEFLHDSSSDFLSIVARENSEVFFIPYGTWHGYEEKHRGIRDFSTTLLSRQMSFLTFVLSARMEQNISKRIALFLLHHYEKNRFGVGNTIRLSHEEIAEQIGTTREVATRNIGILKDKGLVVTGREKVRIIDENKLRLYASIEARDTLEE